MGRMTLQKKRKGRGQKEEKKRVRIDRAKVGQME